MANGLTELHGRPLARLRRIASEANDQIDRLVELASSRDGPALWLDRIELLERALTDPNIGAAETYDNHAIARAPTEKEQLLDFIDRAQKAEGFEEEILEAKQRLAMLETCESDSAP